MSKRKAIGDRPEPHSSVGEVPEPDSTSPDEEMAAVEELQRQEAATLISGMEIIKSSSKIKSFHLRQFRYNKRFNMKLYGLNWTSAVETNIANTIYGWMNVVPWEAVCFYISPNEYMHIIRDSSFAKINDLKFQMQYRGVRTPFTAGAMDVQDANGNLGFDICRFDGLEQMMPFKTFDADFGNTLLPALDYVDLINRLYGNVALGANTTTSYPASMIERGLSEQPGWAFANGTGGGFQPPGAMGRDVNKLVTTLPIFEYCSEILNTNQVKHSAGYCFTKQYRPKNGILSTTGTSYCAATMQGALRCKVPRDITTADNAFPPLPDFGTPIMSDGPNDLVPPAGYQIGSNMDITEYSRLAVENYETFMGGHSPNYTKLNSMCIGILPKLNSDASFVKAIADFIITTEMTVDMNTEDNIYINFAKNTSGEYILPGLTDAAVFGGKWTTHERNIPLAAAKNWNRAYGAFGQPTFIPFASQ